MLGRDKHAVIASLVTGMPHPYAVASEDTRLCGVLIETDDANGRAVSIERVNIPEPLPVPTGDDDNG